MENRIGGHKQTWKSFNNHLPFRSFHLLPSGLMNPKWYYLNPLRPDNSETDISRSINFIGSGVVFHVPSFFKELEELKEKGLPSVHDRILVSDRVHIDLQMHVAVDGLEEKELGGWSLGFRQP